jgi:hypothetical protein
LSLQAGKNGAGKADYRLPRAKTLAVLTGPFQIPVARSQRLRFSSPPMSLLGSHINAGIPKRSKGIGQPGSKNLNYHAPATARSSDGVPPPCHRLRFISPSFHPRQTAVSRRHIPCLPCRAFSRLAAGRRNVHFPEESRVREYDVNRASIVSLPARRQGRIARPCPPISTLTVLARKKFGAKISRREFCSRNAKQRLRRFA